MAINEKLVKIQDKANPIRIGSNGKIEMLSGMDKLINRETSHRILCTCAKWNNGKYGQFAIVEKPNPRSHEITSLYGSYNVTLRFVECDSNLTNYKHPISEWIEKCPMVAEGFIVFYLSKHNKNATNIYNDYYCTLRNMYIEHENKKSDAHKRDLSGEFYKRHIAKEKGYLERSQVLLFDYLMDEDKEEMKSYVDNYFEYIQNMEKETTEKRKNKIDSKNDNNKRVFIVHGHDEAFKNEVALFVTTLELSYVILHTKANQGRTLIEKLDGETDNIAFAIILYTACDVGKNKRKKEKLKDRARQNVVFEHGYLMGKLGRNRVCLLQKGNIELPSDISGVVYSRSNNWKEELRIELKAIGLID